MPMWPFSRRAAKLKTGRSTAVAEGKRPVAAYAHESADNDALRRTPKRRSSRRNRRSAHSTSMRDVDKSSPNPPPAGPPFVKHDSHSLPHSSAEDITALPISKRLEQSPHLRPVTNEHGIPYNFQSHSHSSLPTARERGKLQRPQSLRKRSAYESALPRRKSSKKRKNDHVREEEIRAMSVPLPQKRPAGHSGGLLRRDSKKVKGGLNRHFERPASNISLPVEDSIHSSMSGSSESRAFRVSALDMFSPRPRIRYSVGSQYCYSASGPSPTSHQSKTEPRKERTPPPKDGIVGKRSKTIDDLADTLDAGALREILERDKRRREKKRKADDERLRRRLERRAEKQKVGEQSGIPATPRREAKGVVGLGIERDTFTPMEDVRPSTPPKPQRLHTTGFTTNVEENSQLPTPMETPVEEPVVADAQAVRYSRASISSPPTSPVHTRGPSNISQMPELLSEKAARETPVESIEPDARASGPLHHVESADTAATSKKESGRRRSSEGRRMRAFASFFRRGRRNSQDQARATPSEVSFSNTSRESMSRQPLPAHLVAPTPPVQIRRPSSVPHRTMSKFREDLPEFPLSPPDSRVHSPEAAVTNLITAQRESQPPSDLRVHSNSPGAGARTDSPSLASVDSEGSWLSGKPLKRRSNKSYIRSSVGSSTTAKQNEEFSASYEELGIPDDEYFQRLTPQPDERRRSAQTSDVVRRKPSSTAMAATDTTADSDDEEPVPAERPSEEENLVQNSVGRQPTIVHRQPRVKSTEALLGYFQAEKPPIKEIPATNPERPADQESPTSDSEPISLQRAQSVDLGKNHGRHLSAGSAKLLDIPGKRSSIDQKRSSPASQSKLTEQDE
ncbi:uncharacterized protein BDR25DRAFT_323665 [Lindgomyces ingoldianus]|uniref:Uncharacterized protein n=1 Tax=Lindgomyces ingoldianus TaxID=673940 RepID=A0ACB6R434_9PLEO|nr:uncharacterized protein BDR25DRAFT_323665 [Lindgomyces ingoldianus]KAF2474014.1 hypothetical protein BDR25DRAFT_323665 [Lindgomyces ingoldianus]